MHVNAPLLTTDISKTQTAQKEKKEDKIRPDKIPNLEREERRKKGGRRKRLWLIERSKQRVIMIYENDFIYSSPGIVLPPPRIKTTLGIPQDRAWTHQARARTHSAHCRNLMHIDLQYSREDPRVLTRCSLADKCRLRGQTRLS